MNGSIHLQQCVGPENTSTFQENSDKNIASHLHPCQSMTNYFQTRLLLIWKQTTFRSRPRALTEEEELRLKYRLDRSPQIQCKALAAATMLLLPNLNCCMKL